MKIVELAERLIRHKKADVDIVFTGLRPNEKLHEVLNSEGEVMHVGPHDRIWHTAAANYAVDGIDLEPVSKLDGPELADALLGICGGLTTVDNDSRAATTPMIDVRATTAHDVAARDLTA